MVELAESNNHRSDCFLEIDRKGCQVVQLGDLRIACAWPPFADAREITIVRPVAKLQISDYELDPRLIERLSNHLVRTRFFHTWKDFPLFQLALGNFVG